MRLLTLEASARLEDLELQEKELVMVSKGKEHGLAIKVNGRLIQESVDEDDKQFEVKSLDLQRRAQEFVEAITPRS